MNHTFMLVTNFSMKFLNWKFEFQNIFPSNIALTGYMIDKCFDKVNFDIAAYS